MINLIDKYECLTGKEVPPCFEEQTKTIENQVEKLTKAIEVHAKQLIKSEEIDEDSLPLDKPKFYNPEMF